jgi:hypothetical protein
MAVAAIFSWHTVPPVIQTVWAGSNGVTEAYVADPTSPLALLVGPPGRGSSGTPFEFIAVQSGAQTIPTTADFVLLAINGLMAALTEYSVFAGNVYLNPGLQVVAGDHILIIPR